MRPSKQAEGGKTPGFPGFALLASERRLREEGERGGREGGDVLGLQEKKKRKRRKRKKVSFFGFGLIKGQFFKYRKEKRKEKSLRGRGGVSEGAVGLLEPTWLVSGTATCSPGFLSLRISYEFEKILFNLPNFPQFLAMVH